MSAFSRAHSKFSVKFSIQDFFNSKIKKIIMIWRQHIHKVVLRLPDSWSNWNLKMLVFQERRKPEYPEKNLSEQRREPTTNSTHIWRGRQNLNPGHIVGGRRSALTTAPSFAPRKRPNHHPKLERNGPGFTSRCSGIEPSLRAQDGFWCVSLADLELTCFRVFQFQDRCRLHHEIGVLSNGHSKMQFVFSEL